MTTETNTRVSLADTIRTALAQGSVSQRDITESAILLLQAWLGACPEKPTAEMSPAQRADALRELFDSWAPRTPEEQQDAEESLAILREGLNRGRPKGYEVLP